MIVVFVDNVEKVFPADTGYSWLDMITFISKCLKDGHDLHIKVK